MKKIIALLLAITFIFTLSACGKEETSSDPDTSVPAQSQDEGFTAPESYASVLLVTINPQFKLYLDKDGVVLAMEPVNDDAKSFYEDIEFENKGFQDVVETIVTKAGENGFVKENAQITFEVSEKKDESVNVNFILNNVTAIAKQAANKLEVKVTVKAEDKTEKADETSSEEKPAESKPQQTTSSNTENAHTHTFAAATCTEAKKCSCGATEGSPLGHDYKDGVCSRCKAKDPDFVSYTSVAKKVGCWEGEYFEGKNATGATIYIYENAPDGYMLFMGGYYLAELPEEINSEDAVTLSNGKVYIMGLGNGGAELAAVAEDGKKITLTDDSGKKLELERTGENTMKVIAATAQFSDLDNVPAGMVFTFKETTEE